MPMPVVSPARCLPGPSRLLQGDVQGPHSVEQFQKWMTFLRWALLCLSVCFRQQACCCPAGIMQQLARNSPLCAAGTCHVCSGT